MLDLNVNCRYRKSKNIKYKKKVYILYIKQHSYYIILKFNVEIHKTSNNLTF